jgi:hypothetical protein
MSLSERLTRLEQHTAPAIPGVVLLKPGETAAAVLATLPAETRRRGVVLIPAKQPENRHANT